MRVRSRGLRWAASAIVGSLAIGASASAVQAAMVAAPPSDADRAAAFAEPAIVTVAVAWQGYEHDGSGALVDPGQVQVVIRCTAS